MFIFEAKGFCNDKYLKRPPIPNYISRTLTGQ